MAEEAWVAWVRTGEWGDSELQPLAWRTLKGAKRWCNENRKLEEGTPVTWHQLHDGEVQGTCTVRVTYPAGKKAERVYLLQPVKLED
jgi:hypothetical protein